MTTDYDVDQIDAYDQTGTDTETGELFYEPDTRYPQPSVPHVQRVIQEPCTHWSAATYVNVAPNTTIKAFAGGPLTIGRVTITPEALTYVTTADAADVSASFPIQAGGSLSFTVSEPVYLWMPVIGDVSVLIEMWAMDDNRL